MDGHENHDISLGDAAEMTRRYRDQMTEGQFLGGSFGSDALRGILDQKDCIGIKYYYGLDSNNQQVLILVGITEDNNDMVDGNLAELSTRCPVVCGENNVLNS